MTQLFARRLRNILIRERLNPADVARCLGGQHRDGVTVSNWLSGRNEPNMRNLLRLSTALDVEPMEFISKTIPEASSGQPVHPHTKFCLTSL